MSRACRVLGACAALRRRGVGPPFVSTWTLHYTYTVCVRRPNTDDREGAKAPNGPMSDDTEAVRFHTDYSSYTIYAPQDVENGRDCRVV